MPKQNKQRKNSRKINSKSILVGIEKTENKFSFSTLESVATISKQNLENKIKNQFEYRHHKCVFQQTDDLGFE